MKLSVIIPTHCRPILLQRLLSSIEMQSFPVDQFEVIVVSNIDEEFFSTNRFKFWKEKFNLVYCVSGRRGANKARNIGINKAIGEIVLMLDDDCVLLQKNYFDEVLKFHALYPEAFAIGGGYSHSSEANSVDKAYNFITSQWQEPEFYGDLHSTRLVGGNVSYKRDLLTGLDEMFDEKIVYGGTEVEFHERLNRAGKQLLLIPHLVVGHDAGIDLKQLIRKAYHQSRGKTFQNSEIRTSAYQPLSHVLSLYSSTSDEEHGEICSAIEVYDQSFKLAGDKSDWSLEKVSKTILKKYDRREVFR